jgi:hypothetical protein
MKKIIIAVIVLMYSDCIIAQVKVGIKGSWNYSSARAVYSGMKQSTGFISGYGAGVSAKIPFDGALHFSPSVMINRRGFIVKPSAGTNIKEQYGITYLDIIPALSTDFSHGSNSFSIGIGPDFGFTNFGKLKATNSSNVTTSEKLKFGFTHYGWFDLGFQASAGYHMKKTFIEVGYLLGLASINNNEEIDQRNIRNRVLSLSVGYYLR